MPLMILLYYSFSHGNETQSTHCSQEQIIMYLLSLFFYILFYFCCHNFTQTFLYFSLLNQIHNLFKKKLLVTDAFFLNDWKSDFLVPKGVHILIHLFNWTALAAETKNHSEIIALIWSEKDNFFLFIPKLYCFFVFPVDNS